jgi:hypothetical protein
METGTEILLARMKEYPEEFINVNNIAGVAPCLEFPEKTVIELHAGINAGESPGAGRISIGPGYYRTDHPLEGVIGAIEYATKDYR